MAYGQFGVYECMCCHKVATEDPGVFCPDCTETVNSLLSALDKSPYGFAMCDVGTGWVINVEHDDAIDKWTVTQGMEGMPTTKYATYDNLQQIAVAFPQTRWVPLQAEEEC